MLLFSQVEENPKGKATRRRKPKPISQRHRKGPKGENIRQKRSVTFLSQTEGPQAALKKMAESRFSMVLHRVLVRNGPEPGMHLPKEQARAFGLHARNQHAADWRMLFQGREQNSSGDLVCVGKYDGTACPAACNLPRCDPMKLRRLQLDHEHELALTVEKWKTARKAVVSPTTWDAGIDGDALCRLLFGVFPAGDEEAWVRLRCRSCHRGMPHERSAPQIAL